jgi:hypothetical protein
LVVYIFLHQVAEHFVCTTPPAQLETVVGTRSLLAACAATTKRDSVKNACAHHTGVGCRQLPSHRCSGTQASAKPDAASRKSSSSRLRNVCCVRAHASEGCCCRPGRFKHR